VNDKSAGDGSDPPEQAQATDEDPAGTEDDPGAVGGPAHLGEPGPPVDRRAPF
jgi:hypothetical protein